MKKIKVEAIVVKHPKWARVFLRVNDKEWLHSIKETFLEIFPYLSSKHLEDAFDKFLFQDDILFSYADETKLSFSFEFKDLSLIPFVVKRVKERFSEMLVYLKKLHQEIIDITEKQK